MRETTWLPETASRIRALAERLLPSSTRAHVTVSINRLIAANVQAHATSELYLRYLSENFAPATDAERPTITLYYHAGATDWLKDSGYDIGVLATPCVALFDAETNTALISGLDEYGLFKSTAVGLHSRLLFKAGWSPIHAAVVSLDGKGMVITGYHGAGKSTALLNIVHHARATCKIVVLTDDWAVARRRDESVEVQSIENRMSFGEALARDNPELNLMPLYKRYIRGDIGKAWAHVDDVLGAGTYGPQTTLDKILVFASDKRDELISPIPIADTAALLVDSAYHMPDAGGAIHERLTAFWSDVLTNIECVQINNRHGNRPKAEIYTELVRYLNA